MLALRKMRKALQSRYAWPGGYPLYGIMSDGEAICCNCAVKEWRNIYRESRARFTRLDDQWVLKAVEVNWDDPDCFCWHCNERIESVYAEEED